MPTSRSQSYADVLRYAPGGCLLVDDGVVLAANPEAVETTGIPLGRLMGVPLTSRIP